MDKELVMPDGRRRHETLSLLLTLPSSFSVPRWEAFETTQLAMLPSLEAQPPSVPVLNALHTESVRV